ncbi:cytochrome c biogenesis protein CcsA [bacterium]|nr:cytochrome c biogenesis protein CcsA [bacterium]
MMKKTAGIFLIALLILGAGDLATAALPGTADENIRSLAIQSGGRVRTFDAWARDVVHDITGKHTWKGEDPTETVLRWMSDTQAAYVEDVFPLVHEPLRAMIGLDGSDPTLFSMETLVNNDALVRIAEQSQEATAAGRDMTVEQGKAASVFNRVSVLHGLLTRDKVMLIPPFEGEQVWRSVNSIMADSTAPGATVALAWTGLMEAYKRDNAEMVERSARVLNEELNAWYGDDVDTAHLKAELLYRKIDPWSIAKWLYVAAILMAIATTFVKKPWIEMTPRLMLLLGFLVHTGGLALRWYIAQRAPWSNMYESITTAAWGAVLFGLFKYRGAAAKIIAPSAAFVGFSSLFIAAHHSLDPSINPLVPALQSYWLNIHVIVILLGYASATFAAVLGHVWIVNDTFRPRAAKKMLGGVYNAIYRMFQLSVLFLIVGILLGSVWAHSAWGRYWGWDPKETWALITWIYYLGLIHAGYAGRLRERGMAVASVVGFLLVLMTYYGVNYFLSGLHTYASGNAYEIPMSVIVYVSLEVLFLAAYAVHRIKKGKQERDAKAARSSSKPALESR